MKKLRIRQLHLLIHPGFSTQPAFASEESLRAGNAELFRRYREKAEGMGPDEIMVAIAHSSGRELREGVSGCLEYAMFLTRLKGTLGKRLIVTGDFGPGTVDKAFSIAGARGYSVSRWVRSIAYGEMLGECVERVADSFNRMANFHRKTEIEVRYTDCGLFYDSVAPESLAELCRNGAYGRIAYNNSY